MNRSLPPMRLIASLCALLGLLAFTVVLAYQPLGAFNFAVALTIATIKVGIVAVIFMELPSENAPTIGFACAGLLWLAILWWLSWLDYATRPDFPPPF